MTRPKLRLCHLTKTDLIFIRPFVELADAEKSWLDLKVDRQEFLFGEERLIGPSHWSNVSRAFDAVRLTIDHKGYRVDAFSSSVVQPQDGTIDHHDQGNNLHGLYGSFDKLVPNAVFEPYFFWRLEPGSLTLIEKAGKGDLDQKPRPLTIVIS